MKKWKNMTERERVAYGNSFIGATKWTFGYWIDILIFIYFVIFLFTSLVSFVTWSSTPLLKVALFLSPFEHMWVRIVWVCLLIPAWMIYRICQNHINFFSTDELMDDLDRKRQNGEIDSNYRPIKKVSE